VTETELGIMMVCGACTTHPMSVVLPHYNKGRQGVSLHTLQWVNCPEQHKMVQSRQW